MADKGSAAPIVGFGSDNHSGVHPEIFEALLAANTGHQPSYGTDNISHRMRAVFEQHFGAGTEALYVFNGTAANVLSFAATLHSWQSVLCAATSHIHTSECGAPERIAGVKLIAIPSADGKLRVPELRHALVRRGDQHASQAGLLSITQPTELGTVYSLDELRELKAFAQENGLILHIDGARLVNAAESLGVTLRALTRDIGADIVSLGGTKNGLMFGEAVLFLNPDLARDARYVRKQLLQLPSKSRFVAAQFEAFLGTDLWLRNARHANRLAKRLADGLRQRPLVEVTQATQSNAVFVKIPKALVSKLRERHFFYVWDEHTFECRLMITWDTSEATIDNFLSHLDEVSR